MLIVRVRDDGRENPWVTGAGSSLDARPITSDDFEVCVCCVVVLDLGLPRHLPWQPPLGPGD